MQPEVLTPPADPTQTDAFRRWFGQSKVIDPDGRPRPVYHGTRWPIDAFRSGAWFAEDVRLATVFVGGGRRSDARIKQGSQLVPAYLAVSNPLDLATHTPQDQMRVSKFLQLMGVKPSGFGAVLELMESSSLAWWEQVQADPVQRETWSSGFRMPGRRGCSFQQRQLEDCLHDDMPLHSHLDSPEMRTVLRQLGYDGVKMRETVKYNPRLAEGRRFDRKLDMHVESTTWMVLDGTQVKSAIANNGAFDPEDPRIAFKRAAAPQAELEEHEEEERCTPRF